MKASYHTPIILEELFEVEDVMAVSVVDAGYGPTITHDESTGDQTFEADDASAPGGVSVPGLRF